MPLQMRRETLVSTLYRGTVVCSILEHPSWQQPCCFTITAFSVAQPAAWLSATPPEAIATGSSHAKQSGPQSVVCSWGWYVWMPALWLHAQRRCTQRQGGPPPAAHPLAPPAAVTAGSCPGADDDQQLPHALLGLTLLAGFLSMLLLEQAQSRFTGHNHIMHDGRMDHLSDAEDQLDELSPHSPHSIASKQVSIARLCLRQHPSGLWLQPGSSTHQEQLTVTISCTALPASRWALLESAGLW